MAPNQRRSWLAAPAPLQYARADNNSQFLAQVTNPKVFVIASKQQRALALPRPGRSAAGFDRIPSESHDPVGLASWRLSGVPDSFHDLPVRIPQGDMAGSIAVRSRKEECGVDPAVFDEVSRGACL